MLLLLMLGAISCSDALNPNTEESDLEFLDSMTSALISSEQGEVNGNGIFMLNWSAINPRFTDENEKLAMAMAIGFDDEISLQPPYNISTVDMGRVTIRSADNQTVELSKQSSRFSGEHLVYSYRSFGPFQRNASLSFDAGEEYRIQTSGSDVFPSLNLAVTAPDKQVSILTPSDSKLYNHSGDLVLTWDAIPGKPVGIHIRPAINPREGQKPGRFNREESEMIILEDQNGTYTVSEESLLEIAGNSDLNAVQISVGQLHVDDVESDGKTYRVIMRSADHRLIDLN
ncbi:MAG: hypothetical protein R3211_03330 [Balneolaceae bacterium]|nr:hypothetical protein [Balneolaceae bacterium]